MTVDELISKLDFELIKAFHDIITSVEWTQENVDENLDRTEEFYYQAERVWPADIREPVKTLFRKIGNYEDFIAIWYDASQTWLKNPENRNPAPHTEIPQGIAT